MGLWRPRLIMPPGLSRKLTDEELRFVLLHELAHVKRQDLAMLWLLTVVRVVHWFNPLAWVVVWAARRDVELACDATVLRRAGAETSMAYGATLLRFVRMAAWKATAVPAAGIVEQARALKERLTRIGGYAPPTRWNLVFMAVVVVGVGAVFGVDEQKMPDPVVKPGVPKTPATTDENLPAPEFPMRPASEPPKLGGDGAKTAKELPVWAKGWQVVKVTVPKDGEIEDAYVDLRSPDGKKVALYPGQAVQAFLLESVGLAWSPVRAVVHLRKEDETADLLVDGALVSKSDTLEKKPRHMKIEAWFIEIPEAVALTLKDLEGNPLFTPRTKDRVAEIPQDKAVGVTIRKPDERQTYLNLVTAKTDGTVLISSPSVTARSGNRRDN
jgi:hypothetical protein